MLLGVLVSIAVPGVEPEIHRVLIGRANRRAAHDDISADIAFDASNAPAVKVQFDGRAKNGASRGGTAGGQISKIEHRHQQGKSPAAGRNDRCAKANESRVGATRHHRKPLDIESVRALGIDSGLAACRQSIIVSAFAMGVIGVPTCQVELEIVVPSDVAE